MKQLFICIWSFIFTTNCFGEKVPKRVQNSFTVCYSSHTSIRSQLNIDGYYEMKETGHFHNSISSAEEDTFKVYFILYDDGMFVYNIIYNDAPDLASYFQKISCKDKKYFYTRNYWGVYKIEGDTIIAQYINNPPSLAPWFGFQIVFKITDSNTLCYLGSKSFEDKNRGACQSVAIPR